MTTEALRLLDHPIERMQTRLHLKTYLLIAVMVIAGPVGNLLIAKQMKQVGEVKLWPPSELLPLFFRVFGSLTIWLGIACLIGFIVAYMLALSMADYSYVQPAAALGYGVIAILGVIVLGESVSPLRWVGIAIICLGVSFIRNTPPRTTENSR
jgi:drug/metabolite transporter (DMT)-like permease